MNKKQFEWWRSEMENHKKQTKYFTLLLHELTPSELLDLTPVSEWSLSVGSEYLKLFPTKTHSEIRRALIYLADLRERQIEAWEVQIESWKIESEKLERLIRQFSNN